MENYHWLKDIFARHAEKYDTADLGIDLPEGLTYTENGAIVPVTTGSVLIDQFASAGMYRNRPMRAVANDMDKLWAENPELALRFVFYLRLITRVVKYSREKQSSSLQKGQGMRDEAFKRLLWVAKNHPDVFRNNIWILPLVGSWKDIWTLMYMAKDTEHVNLDENLMYALLSFGLRREPFSDLVIKFMPRIKTVSNIKNKKSRVLSDLARGFARYLECTPRQYNKIKSLGNAHDFQRLMCGQEYDKIKWWQIPGIALGKITASKFIPNHGLTENYMDWLAKQDTIKFNGYPYDLIKRLDTKNRSTYFLLEDGMNSVPEIVRKTVDLQFENLIAKVQKEGISTENVLCALDTSGSMTDSATNNNISPIDVCVALGVYFSTLNKGAFHKQVAMFDSTSRMKQLSGTFSEMISQIPRDAWGSTNFESILTMLVDYRKNNPDIPLSEYPSTLLVVSDMQFDPFYRQRRVKPDTETVYQKMKEILYTAFPEDFVDNMKFVWWNVSGGYDNTPATMDDNGCYFFSGMDGSIVSLLLNEEVKPNEPRAKKTMEEIATEALNQEVLGLITVAG